MAKAAHGEPEAWKLARPVRREGRRNHLPQGRQALCSYSTLVCRAAHIATLMTVDGSEAIDWHPDRGWNEVEGGRERLLDPRGMAAQPPGKPCRPLPGQDRETASAGSAFGQISHIEETAETGMKTGVPSSASPPHDGHRDAAVGGVDGECQARRADLAAGGAEGSPKANEEGRLRLNDGSCVRLRPEHPNHVWSYDFVEVDNVGQYEQNSYMTSCDNVRDVVIVFRRGDCASKAEYGGVLREANELSGV